MADAGPSKVALGLEYARASVDNQFARVNQIQAVLGVLLGFVVTAIGLVFSIRRAHAPGLLILSEASLALLMAAAVIFGFGLAVFRLYRDAVPITAVIGLDDPNMTPPDAERRLMERYLRYYEENKRVIRRRFQLVNAGIALLLAGILLFALGGLPF